MYFAHGRVRFGFTSYWNRKRNEDVKLHPRYQGTGVPSTVDDDCILFAFILNCSLPICVVTASDWPGSVLFVAYRFRFSRPLPITGEGKGGVGGEGAYSTLAIGDTYGPH